GGPRQVGGPLPKLVQDDAFYGTVEVSNLDAGLPQRNSMPSVFRRVVYGQRGKGLEYPLVPEQSGRPFRGEQTREACQGGACTFSYHSGGRGGFPHGLKGGLARPHFPAF